MSILNDVLDFSRVEAGRLDLGRIPVDVPAGPLRDPAWCVAPAARAHA